jgi:hypothetical protein
MNPPSKPNTIALDEPHTQIGLLRRALFAAGVIIGFIRLVSRIKCSKLGA